MTPVRGKTSCAAGACTLQVEVRDYDGLPMGAQLQLDLATSVFIMPHGAGCTHAAFLRRGAVFVELVAHGVVERSSFYHGYANLAQLAHVRAEWQHAHCAGVMHACSSLSARALRGSVTAAGVGMVVLPWCMWE